MMNNLMPTLQSFQLTNGVKVHLSPRPQYHQLVALLTVNYGARDQNTWADEPFGTAHFIEHQLFQQSGYDALDKISGWGDTVNAFTTMTQTSYYTIAPAKDYRSLAELLTFTQQPYFQAISVEREQRIIQQEIKMYEDDAGAQLYQNILGALYPNDAIGIDIGGTTTSIAAITPAVLKRAYKRHYRPDNMELFITGDFDQNQILEVIEQSPLGQRPASQHVPVVEVQQFTAMPLPAISVELEGATLRNKIAVGQRLFEQQVVPWGRLGLKISLAYNLALDLVFSEHSARYLDWYDQGLIDDGFSTELTMERGAAHLLLLGETPEPETLIAEIQMVLQHLQTEFLNLADGLELVKSEQLGRYISRLNSLDEIATRFEGPTFDDAFVWDEIEILNTLTSAEISEIIAKVAVSVPVSVIIHPE